MNNDPSLHVTLRNDGVDKQREWGGKKEKKIELLLSFMTK